MASVANVLVFLLAIGVLFVAPPYFIIRGRKQYLRGLVAEAVNGLRRVASAVFDAPPAAAGVVGDRARLEGTRAGEPIAVEASYPLAPNRSGYVNRGYKSRITAEVSVTVGLRGATPAFAFEATWNARVAASDFDFTTGRAPSERELARVWKTLAADPELVDDALRTDLVRFAAQAPVRSVSIGPEGLRIAWLDDAGVVADPSIRRDEEANAFWLSSQTERLTAAAELAMRLRKRILDALDRRAQPHVRVDAYRDGAEEPRIEGEDEAPAQRTMRS